MIVCGKCWVGVLGCGVADGVRGRCRLVAGGWWLVARWCRRGLGVLAGAAGLRLGSGGVRWVGVACGRVRVSSGGGCRDD